MKRIILLFLPALFLLTSCSQSIKYTVVSPTAKPASGKSSVKNDKGISQHDGQCYKKCILPDRYETKRVSYPIYLGADEDAPVRLVTIVIAPPKKQWVKKSTGEISLVETPAVTKEIQILADTIFYRDFRVEQFETQQLVEKGGFQREVPVVCSDARTPNLFLQISGALKSYGYMEESKAQWDGKFNQAIQQFQKDNSLPVGDLNLETLQFLGI